MAITTPIDQTTAAAEPTATAATWAVIRDFARRRTLGAVGAAVVVVMIVLGVFAGLLAPYDPLAVDFGAMLSKPNAAHWLGTAAFGHVRIILRHMLPNVVAPYLIMLTAFLSQAILAESSLSFLGLGVQEPTAAWDPMLRTL